MAKEKKKKWRKELTFIEHLSLLKVTVILSFNHQNQPVRETLFFVCSIDGQTEAPKSKVLCLKTHSKWENIRCKLWYSESKSQYDFPYYQFNSRAKIVCNNCPISLATKQHQR